jgi:hypothetical protein
MSKTWQKQPLLLVKSELYREWRGRIWYNDDYRGGESMGTEMQSTPPILLTQSIWRAEDGRCEACSRPIDRHIAQIVPRMPGPLEGDNAALLCPLCQHFLQSPFSIMRVDKVTAEILASALGMTKPEAAQWLREQLEAFAVFIEVASDMMRVWLPGVGSVTVQTRSGKPPVATSLKLHGNNQWQVIGKPQARSRGLPRVDVQYGRVWGDAGSPESEPPWHSVRLPNQPQEREGSVVANLSIRSAKVSIVVPRDQWPQNFPESTTAAQVELLVSTPEGLTIQSVIPWKGYQKAERILADIEVAGGVAVILMQGRLMPGLSLADAGIVVQRKAPASA